MADVYLDDHQPRVVYRIAKNLWQQVFGGGFYVPGLVPSVYSRDRTRLIAPPGTTERFAAPTPDEAVERWPAAVADGPRTAPGGAMASGLRPQSAT